MVPRFVLMLLLFPLLFVPVTSFVIIMRSSSMKKELLWLVTASIAIAR